MLIQVVSSIIGQLLVCVVRRTCAVVILVVATQAMSSAASTSPDVHETLPRTTTPSVTDDAHADGVDSSVRSREQMTGKVAFMAVSSSRSINHAAPVTESGDRSTADVGERTPDWGGIWRDTATFFGTQIVAAGIIYSMPQSVSGWSDEEKKNTFQKYGRNVFDPVFDKDQFYINYVLHPYWGATYYIRGRERGLDKFSSFVYSALISAMYEFGVECFFEKPSIQDLIVTPVGGSLLGMYVFEPWRESIKRKQELRWYDHAALVATDPLGVLSLGIEKVFGIKSTIIVNYSNPALQRLSSGPGSASKGSRIGAGLQFFLD